MMPIPQLRRITECLIALLINCAAAQCSDTIPFLIINEDSTRTRTTITSGSWDLEKGKVSLSDETALYIDGREIRLVWDGGKRICLAPGYEPKHYVKILHSSNVYQVDILNRHLYWDAYLDCPSDRPSDYQLINRTHTTGYELERKENNKVTTIKIDASLGNKAYCLEKPVGILREKNGHLILFNEYNTEMKDPKHPKEAHGMAKAVIAKDGLKWQILTDDLSISEAGPGTNMILFGRDIVMTGCGLQKLNIDSAQVSCMKSVDKALKQFSEKYIAQEEFYVPVDLYSYKDLLILLWKPYSIEPKEKEEIIEIPTAYVLVLRNGKIIGEIKALRDELTVHKELTMTQKLKVPPAQFPSQWRFPKQSN